jgi:hypothetical protein
MGKPTEVAGSGSDCVVGNPEVIAGNGPALHHHRFSIASTIASFKTG